MSGGSGSTHSLACFAASVAFSQRHETSHTLGLRRGNAQNPGGLFKRRERRFDDAWSAHPVSTLAGGICEYKSFDALGEALEASQAERQGELLSCSAPIPLCRRPARTVSEVEGKRLEKMHFVLSLRASRFAPACGSAEGKSFSPDPGFRKPAMATISDRRSRSTLGCHRSPQQAPLLPLLGWTYVVPPAL